MVLTFPEVVVVAAIAIGALWVVVLGVVVVIYFQQAADLRRDRENEQAVFDERDKLQRRYAKPNTRSAVASDNQHSRISILNVIPDYLPSAIPSSYWETYKPDYEKTERLKNAYFSEIFESDEPDQNSAFLHAHDPVVPNVQRRRIA